MKQQGVPISLLRLMIVVLASFYVSFIAYADPEPEPLLPPGLAVVQLDGNLVCPPLLIRQKGILVACDDRTVSMIGLAGGRLWRLEMDRFIRGPLFSCTPSLTLVTLSGDQIAAVRSDGSLAWQRRFPESEGSWFLGSPEGRVVQIIKSGEIRFFNPDGTPLFVLPAERSVVGLPRANARGIQLTNTGGTQTFCDWAGNRIFIQTKEIETSASVENNLHFALDPINSTEYRVSIEGSAVRLEFNSHGSPGHWLVDNSDGATIVWGDSLWRCFVFRIVDEGYTSESQGFENPNAVQPSPNAIPQPLGIFENLSPAAELERRYLETILRDNAATGASTCLDHIESVLDSGKLIGRLYLYEDFLSIILESQMQSKVVQNQAIILRTLGILSRFPSTRSLEHLVPFLDKEKSPTVINAWFSWFISLGLDPDARILASILHNLPRWQTIEIVGDLKKNLGLIAQSLGASWPRTDERARFFAWAQISVTH